MADLFAKLEKQREDELRRAVDDLERAVVELSSEVRCTQDQLQDFKVVVSEQVGEMKGQVGEIHNHLLGEATKQSAFNRKLVWRLAVGLMGILAGVLGIKLATG